MKLFASVLQIAGLCVASFGLGMLVAWAGWLALGASTFYVGYELERAR